MNTGNQSIRRPVGRGLRKLTPGLLAGEALSKELDRDVARQSERFEWRNAVATLQRARELRPAAANLLMALIKFCGTWEREGVAVVFATNERLADELGLSQTRSIRALLRELSSGRRPLICHIDRPGGRRGVEVDPITGEKTYYGISLEPLIAQLAIIEGIQAEMDDAYRERRRLKSAILAMLTRHERVVAAAIDAGMDRETWWARNDLLDGVSLSIHDETSIAVLREVHGEIERVLSETESVYQARLDKLGYQSQTTVAQDTKLVTSDVLIKEKEDSGYEDSNAPPITINKSLTDKSEQCTASGRSSREKRGTTFKPANAGRFSLETKHVAPTSNKSEPVELDETTGKRGIALMQVIDTDLKKKKIGPDELCAISEDLHAFLPFHAADDPLWEDVAHAADLARSHIGLSEAAWRHSIGNLGPKGAIAALAYATASPDVRSPAGYIRRLADLASDGRFIDLGDKVRKLIRQASGTRQ